MQNLLTWQSKKQQVVARSSAKVEFYALAHGICEGIWIKRVLYKLIIKVEGSIERNMWKSINIL